MDNPVLAYFRHSLNESTCIGISSHSLSSHPRSPSHLIAFALREVEAVLNARHAAGDELLHGGADHVRQREDAQHEEVHREQQVDVVLAEYLKWTF